MKMLLIAFLFPLSALADSFTDAMFDRTRLHDVRITMPESDWSKLRANYLDNTNYDATLTIDGETIGNSSIRSRGSATRNPIKPGLRVDFSKKVKTQTFHGFKVLVLDNMYNDFSFVREQLAFAMFEEMHIRVPRESFARLTVNDQYWGLYAIVEPIDKVFVTTHVDGGEGNLFEYNAPAAQTPGQLLAWDFTLSRGDKVEDYVPSPFEPKTNEDHLDGSALLAFIRAVSDGGDVAAFVDPKELLTYYAIEVASAEVDGLTGYFGPNNFYLYQLQGTQRFLFIPWDHDFNFTAATHPVYFGAERNRLIERLLTSPELAEFYRTTLQSIIDRFMNPSWMTPRIDAFVALIREPVQQDTKRRDANFDEAVTHVREVIGGRGAHVDAQLRPSRRRGAGH